MRKSDIDLLFSYNRWANARILEACAGMRTEELTGPAPVSFGSLLGTLAHIFGAENVWRMRLQQGISPQQMARVEDIASFDALVARWGEEEAAMLDFLAPLKDGDMDRKVHFKRLNGTEEEATLWKALVHIVLHGMQFRAEAGVVLSQMGRSPGDLDFIFYLREIRAR